MPYANEHAARIRQPGLFARIVQLQRLPNGVRVLGGPLKTNPRGGSKTQAYRFPRQRFTVEQAKKWLRDHKIKWISFEKATGETQEMTGTHGRVAGIIRRAAKRKRQHDS